MSSTGASSKTLDHPPAVFCDFDDTIAEVNVAELLLQKFGTSGWQELQRQSRERLIFFREYQEGAFRDISAGREEMKAYVQEHVALRPGFPELWRDCQASGTPLAVVTLGLDFYVDALLEREGLQAVPIYAVKTAFTPQGLEYSYLHTWDGCVRWGNCKCSVLESYRERGHSIIYVGDGPSDFCPASRADLVFAHRQLVDHCREGGIPYLPFGDFRDVVGYLQRRRRDQDPRGESR